MESNRIDILDFLKGISIITIVLFHLSMRIDIPDSILKFNPFSGVGVHTFIFVSGFSLYLSYLKKPLGILAFYKKRLTSVYIPYILVVLIFALVYFAIGHEQSTFYSLFGHVLLYKMFDNNIIGSYAYYFWFISTIIQFYLVFPFIVKLKKNMNNISFVIVSLIISLLWSMVVVLLEKQSLRTWNSFFLQYLWEFNLGMVFAALFVNKNWAFWKIKNVYLILITIVGFIMFFMLPNVFGNKAKMFNDIFGSLAFTSLIVLSYKVDIKIWRKFGLVCGKYSYDIYLVHGLVFLVLNLFSFKGVHMALLYSVIFAILLYAFAITNNYLVKKIKMFLKI